MQSQPLWDICGVRPSKNFAYAGPSVLRCWNPGAWNPLGAFPGRSDCQVELHSSSRPSAAARSLANWNTRCHGQPARQRGGNLQFTSVRGAQDPVATVSWSTAAMGHQLGVTDNAAACRKAHGAQDAAATAFLGHSLSMCLLWTVSRLQPLGNAQMIKLSRKHPHADLIPVVPECFLGSDLVAPTCTAPFHHGWARPAPSKRG